MTPIKPKDLVCPACEEGELWPKVGTNTIEIDGIDVQVPCHYSVCDSCGSEIGDQNQVSENKLIASRAESESRI